MTEPDISSLINDGMRRQFSAFREALGSGMPRLGWKIGVNDPAAQQRLGIPAPLVGWLDGRRVFEAGEVYRPTAGAKPRIEAEAAIHVSANVPLDATLDDARAAIAGVAAALEFVDGTKPFAPLNEMLAHDILHDGVLFGAQLELEAAAGLVAAGFPAVSLNGEPHRTGRPGRYPDDLGEVVLHVAQVLGKHGEALRAGDWIIAGTYIDPFDVDAGDKVVADFGPLGVLAFSVES